MQPHKQPLGVSAVGRSWCLTSCLQTECSTEHLHKQEAVLPDISSGFQRWWTDVSIAKQASKQSRLMNDLDMASFSLQQQLIKQRPGPQKIKGGVYCGKKVSTWENFGELGLLSSHWVCPSVGEPTRQSVTLLQYTVCNLATSWQREAIWWWVTCSRHLQRVSNYNLPVILLRLILQLSKTDSSGNESRSCLPSGKNTGNEEGGVVFSNE